MIQQGVRHLHALLPIVWTWVGEKCFGRHVDRGGPLLSRIEAEMARPKYRGTFVEFNEMVVQFGYIVLFAVAFPAGALLCYINNVLERKTDAMKVLLHCQRPRAIRVNSIGSWAKILEVLSILAVFTNCGLLYFASSTLADFGSNVKIGIVVGTEHVLLFLKLALMRLIPDEPFWVIAERAKFERRMKELVLEQEVSCTAL